MGKLRKEINELKEKYDARFEAFSKKYEEQNQMILNKLITIGDRVRKLENPEPGNGQTHKSELQKVKEVSQKFASNTSFYGLTHIFKANGTTMKLIWTLTTLVSLLFGLIIVMNSINDFYKYGVFTYTKRIYQESSILPAVTFCTDNSTDINALITDAKFANNTILIGEEFHNKDLLTIQSYNCKMFNNHRNRTDQELFHATDQNGFLFGIDINITFHFISIYLSDNYINILDTSHYVTGVGNKARGNYFIDVTKSKEYILEEPYNDCTKMADKTYRQANCVAQCLNDNVVRTLNCTIRNYYSSPGYNYCPFSKYPEFVSTCKQQCPQECEATKYEALLITYTNSDDKDKLSINVVYSDKSYLEIKQTPKTNQYALVSSIGGALGLFIGIRFLSMVELLEYLADIFFIFYRAHS